ncbi:MAG: hypothetical protein HY549_00805 [Elusimicrobia bacterium]|nr:hypothetical protein [Elusimicrobiota bacterium]
MEALRRKGMRGDIHRTFLISLYFSLMLGSTADMPRRQILASAGAKDLGSTLQMKILDGSRANGWALENGGLEIRLVQAPTAALPERDILEYAIQWTDTNGAELINHKLARLMDIAPEGRDYLMKAVTNITGRSFAVSRSRNVQDVFLVNKNGRTFKAYFSSSEGQLGQMQRAFYKIDGSVQKYPNPQDRSEAQIQFERQAQAEFEQEKQFWLRNFSERDVSGLPATIPAS